MTHTTTKVIKNAYNSYIKSNLCTLSDCYRNASYNKQCAYDYCLSLMLKYNGQAGCIIGYNCMVFSFGFIGEIYGRQAFFYITRDYDRYIYLDELNA